MSTFKDMNILVVVAMLQLANINHNLSYWMTRSRKTKEMGMGIGFLVRPWLTADIILQLGRYV